MDSDKYLEVMGAAMGAMHTGRSNIGAAYDGGTMYVKIGGVETKQKTIGYAKQYKNYLQMCENHGIEHHVEGTNWTWTAASKEAIDALVNLQNQTRDWYHADETPSHDEHSITRRTDLSHWQVKPDLPMDYECEGGDCKVTFQSPWEAFDSHRVTCKKDYVNRSFFKGCNKSWYVCDSDLSTKVERHKIRYCAKLLVYGDGTSTVCKEPYKNCTNWKWDHDNSNDWYWPTNHSDVADDTSNETTQNTVTPTPVQVDNSPNCEHCTDSCSACTQPSYHACGVCETSVSGDHSLQASCSLSNNWMRMCTVTNFYACQPHTCVFPTFQCGRKTCAVAVADPQEHRRISIDGIKYWSCNPSAVEAHKTRYCTKLKVTRQEWNSELGRYEGVEEVCGEAFTKHNQRSCTDIYGATTYHKE